MKKLFILLCNVALASSTLFGMEDQPHVKRPRGGSETSLASIPTPSPFITFISKDNKSVTVLRDQLTPFYGGVALASMQEAQKPTIKLDFNFQAISLLPQILSAYVAAHAMKQNSKEYIKNILYAQINPLSYTMIPILIEMEAFYDFFTMLDAKNAIHEIVHEIRQKHFIATNQKIDIPGYEEFLGFSISQLRQQGKLTNAVVQHPDGSIHLNLSDFQIYSLDGIETLVPAALYRNIVYIDLSNNIIENLSDSFVAFINQLPNLLSLNLNTNKLKSLPNDFLTNAPVLQEFLISQNKLTQLPSHFLANAPEMQRLDLSDNRLTQLPNGFLGNSLKLQQVWLQQNQLTQLPTNFLANCPALQELWLFQNKLAQLPTNFLANAFALKKLALNQNQLVSLPANFLSNVTQLKELLLHKNNLTQLPVNLLRSATKLKILSLNDNKLKSVPYGFMAANTNLELLILNGNPLYRNLMVKGFAALPLHIQTAVTAGNKDYFNFLQQQDKERSAATKRPASTLAH